MTLMFDQTIGYDYYLKIGGGSCKITKAIFFEFDFEVFMMLFDFFCMNKNNIFSF